jgi:hypothetical protein
MRRREATNEEELGGGGGYTIEPDRWWRCGSSGRSPLVQSSYGCHHTIVSASGLNTKKIGENREGKIGGERREMEARSHCRQQCDEGKRGLDESREV